MRLPRFLVPLLALALTVGCGRNAQVPGTIKAHSEAITGIALSPDGRQALTCGQDRYIRHWDLDSGHLLREIGPLDDAEESVAFAGGGQWAVSVGEHKGRGLHLWDLKTGALLRSMEEPVINGSLSPMRRLAVSADGKRALAPGRGEAITLWDLASGTVVIRGFGHWNNSIALGFGPGEATLVSAGEDGQAMVHDAVTGKEQRRIGFSHESGMIVGFTHGGTILPGGRRALVDAWSDGHRLALIDLESGQILRKFEGHKEDVASISVDQQGRRAASAGWDGVRLWDLDSGAELAVLQEQVQAVAMDAEGRYAALGGRDGRIRFKAWPAREKVTSIASEQVLISGESLYGCAALAMAPDGQTLWTASGSRVQAWTFPSGRLVRTLTFERDPLAGKLLFQTQPNGQTRLQLDPQPQSIQSLALSPDGQRLLTGETGPQAALRLWDLQSGQPLGQLPGCAGSVRFSADGREAYSSQGSGLQVTDLATGKVTLSLSPSYPPGLGTQIFSWLRTGQDAPSGARRLVVSGDARWALVAFVRDHKVAFWDCEAKEERASLGTHKQPVTALALSPSADLALSGDEGGTVRLHSTFGRRRSKSTQAHRAEITAAAFSNDGRYAATGDKAGTIQLWDAKRLDLVCTFRGALKEATSLTFSPDGRWLIALGSYDTAIHVWRIPE